MDKEVFMKNKKKIIIVVAVIAVSLIGFSLINSTYSLFYHEDTSKNTEGYSTGTLSITASSKGGTVSLSDALPVEDSVGSASTPYTFTVTNTGNLNYKFNIKLLSTGSSSTTIDSQYIKLKVDDGSIATLSSLSNGIIKKDVTLAAGESIDINVRVWLSISTPNSQIGKTFNSKIVIDGQAVYTKDNFVSSLFTPNKVVTNNGINYQYDTTHSLMKDVDGNIRYYGTNAEIEEVPAYKSEYTVKILSNIHDSVDLCLEDLANYNVCAGDGYEDYGYSDQATCENDYDIGTDIFASDESFTYNESKTKLCSGTVKEYVPKEINNYIYFNCSDYSNQSSSTCETWRIIGSFGNKLKLIRNEPIGNYSWDNKNTSTGAETNNGKNDWSDARLMKLLNPGYESETTGGSLYYNAKSGNCYSGQNNATTTCNFTSTGIKNDKTRSLIADTTYYLGGWNDSEIYPNEIYGYERGTKVFSGRTTIWTGKIALPYPSDYGYAFDFDKCSQTLVDSANNSCISNNWMNTIVTSVSEAGPGDSKLIWLLTPYSGNSYYAWHVSSYGYVDIDGYGAYRADGVAPVLYLNSELDIKAGTGSSSDPYQLSA